MENLAERYKKYKSENTDLICKDLKELNTDELLGLYPTNTDLDLYKAAEIWHLYDSKREESILDAPTLRGVLLLFIDFYMQLEIEQREFGEFSELSYKLLCLQMRKLKQNS